jgi:hypothetical protein
MGLKVREGGREGSGEGARDASVKAGRLAALLAWPTSVGDSVEEMDGSVEARCKCRPRAIYNRINTHRMGVLCSTTYLRSKNLA